jgi:pyruvate/2-oxoglutarate dehydrogenase complex dihydrolipoamide dehydrogenase (E3) component
MGGDCLNVGCVPSKAVVRAARAWHEARHGHDRFGAPRAAGRGDFAAAMARMRRLRADRSDADSVQRFRGLGVDLFLGHGRFAARDALEVAGGAASVPAGGDRDRHPAGGAAGARPRRRRALHERDDRLADGAPRRLAVVGLAAIARTIYPYPTQGEIVRKAADAWQRTRLTPAARRVLGLSLDVLR